MLISRIAKHLCEIPATLGVNVSIEPPPPPSPERVTLAHVVSSLGPLNSVPDEDATAPDESVVDEFGESVTHSADLNGITEALTKALDDLEKWPFTDADEAGEKCLLSNPVIARAIASILSISKDDVDAKKVVIFERVPEEAKPLLLSRLVTQVAFQTKRLITVRNQSVSVKRGFRVKLECDQRGEVPRTFETIERRTACKAAGCKWGVTLYADGVDWDDDPHSDGCVDRDFNTTESLRKNPALFRMLFPKSAENEIVASISRRMENDRTLTPNNFRKEIEGDFRRNLGLEPPRFFVDQVLRKAVQHVRGGAQERNSVSNMVQDLATRNIPHRVMLSPADNCTVLAVIWFDARCAPKRSELCNVSVISHDCTFNVAEDGAGFPHLSLFTTVSISKQSKVLAGAILVSESTDTFLFLCNAMVEIVDPTLAFRPVVVLCDEDMAFINAVTQVWTGAEVIVCFWHKMKNFLKPRSRSQKRLKRDTAGGSADADTSDEEEEGELNPL